MSASLFPDERIPEPEPGRCRSCGARIWWVLLVSGKKMPVNHERVLVRRSDAPEDPNDDLGPIDERGPVTVVTRDGRTVAGRRIAAQYDPGPGQELPPEIEVGGRSHFATCPQSRQWRRAKR